jgi:hypothetical protein
MSNQKFAFTSATFQEKVLGVSEVNEKFTKLSICLTKTKKIEEGKYEKVHQLWYDIMWSAEHFGAACPIEKGDYIRFKCHLKDVVYKPYTTSNGETKVNASLWLAKYHEIEFSKDGEIWTTIADPAVPVSLESNAPDAEDDLPF